ncbi:MAG: hypothetical protein HOM96_00605 [Rickettsiales bacterium]|jgi:hypothetical protein|nr:hypothetical protein [Rickettsiales bacterium]
MSRVREVNVTELISATNLSRPITLSDTLGFVLNKCMLSKPVFSVSVKVHISNFCEAETAKSFAQDSSYFFYRVFKLINSYEKAFCYIEQNSAIFKSSYNTYTSIYEKIQNLKSYKFLTNYSGQSKQNISRVLERQKQGSLGDVDCKSLLSFSVDLYKLANHVSHREITSHTLLQAKDLQKERIEIQELIKSMSEIYHEFHYNCDQYFRHNIYQSQKTLIEYSPIAEHIKFIKQTINAVKHKDLGNSGAMASPTREVKVNEDLLISPATNISGLTEWSDEASLISTIGAKSRVIARSLNEDLVPQFAIVENLADMSSEAVAGYYSVSKASYQDYCRRNGINPLLPDQSLPKIVNIVELPDQQLREQQAVGAFSSGLRSFSQSDYVIFMYEQLGYIHSDIGNAFRQHILASVRYGQDEGFFIQDDSGNISVNFPEITAATGVTSIIDAIEEESIFLQRQAATNYADYYNSIYYQFTSDLPSVYMRNLQAKPLPQGSNPHGDFVEIYCSQLDEVIKDNISIKSDLLRLVKEGFIKSLDGFNQCLEKLYPELVFAGRWQELKEFLEVLKPGKEAGYREIITVISDLIQHNCKEGQVGDIAELSNSGIKSSSFQQKLEKPAISHQKAIAIIER